VVCPSDRPMNGRKKPEPVPVKRFAQRCGLQAFDTPAQLKSLKTWDFPATDNFDVGVVVSFGYFLVRHWRRSFFCSCFSTLRLLFLCVSSTRTCWRTCTTARSICTRRCCRRYLVVVAFEQNT